MELDFLGVGPFHAVHAEQRAQQPVRGRHALLVRHGQHQHDPVHQERELTAGTKEARRFRDPAVGVGPDGGAVLADREVKARVREWHRLGVAEQEREFEPVLPLQAMRRLELRR
jgi:hypothetical protein